MKKLIIFSIIFTVVVLIGYLCTVGMCWLIIYLLGILGFKVLLNVWVLGMIVFIVSWFIKHLFSNN